MAYFNTTSQTGQTLGVYKQSAERQESLIYEMYKHFKSLTPSQVWKYWRADSDHRQVPITSIRRAISNLANNGLLVKTEQKVPGLYDRPEHIYRLNQ